MIELRDDTLVFSFPEVHADAVMIVEFQRTLRIPDDDRDYPLPPGLGTFPLRHVDDAAARVPQSWLRRGGVMLPMYQSEAMWLNFRSPQGYPFALKVGTGKINAVTGAQWADELKHRPQDYLSIPEQPWLDGYCVEKGLIRAFKHAWPGRSFRTGRNGRTSSGRPTCGRCTTQNPARSYERQYGEVVAAAGDLLRYSVGLQRLSSRILVRTTM